MTAADCPSCQWGDHEGHLDIWRPPPANVVGAFTCDCSGDCTNRMSDIITDIIHAMEQPIEPDEPNLSCFQHNQKATHEQEDN